MAKPERLRQIMLDYVTFHNKKNPIYIWKRPGNKHVFVHSGKDAHEITETLFYLPREQMHSCNKDEYKASNIQSSITSRAPG